MSSFVSAVAKSRTAGLKTIAGRKFFSKATFTLSSKSAWDLDRVFVVLGSGSGCCGNSVLWRVKLLPLVACLGCYRMWLALPGAVGLDTGHCARTSPADAGPVVHPLEHFAECGKAPLGDP